MDEKRYIKVTQLWYPKDQSLEEFHDALEVQVGQVAPGIDSNDIMIEFSCDDWGERPGDVQVEISHRRIETDQEVSTRKSKEAAFKIHKANVTMKQDMAELQRLLTKYGKG